MKALVPIMAAGAVLLNAATGEAQHRGHFSNPGHLHAPFPNFVPQVGVPHVGVPQVGFGNGVSAVGFGFGGGYPYFSSTIVEGYQRGLGDLIRSSAVAGHAYSQALINIELARAQFIENQRRYVEVGLENSRRLAEARAQYWAYQRARRQPYIEFNRQRGRLLQIGLAEEQFRRDTGELDWPRALLDDEYAPQRQQIEALLELAAQENAADDLPGLIYSSVIELRNHLRENVYGTPATDYAAAKRFLDRLAYEAQDRATS